MGSGWFEKTVILKGQIPDDPHKNRLVLNRGVVFYNEQELYFRFKHLTQVLQKDICSLGKHLIFFPNNKPVRL